MIPPVVQKIYGIYRKTIKYTHDHNLVNGYVYNGGIFHMALDLFVYTDRSNYKLRRPPIVNTYRSRIIDYLKRENPNDSIEEISAFADMIISDNIRVPELDIAYHPRYGVTEYKTVRLPELIKLLGDNILSPAGSVYVPSSVQKSVISELLEEKKQERNYYKHKQIEAAAVGNDLEESTNKTLQTSAKIFVNSTPGATGFKGSFLYDIPNYNSITSGGRLSVMTGYSQTERMLAANLYVTCIDDIVNYCTVLLEHYPGDNEIASTIENAGLIYPSVSDTFNYFNDSLSINKSLFANSENMDVNRLTRYIASMSDGERAFVTYTYSILNLFRINSHVTKQFVKDMFNRDVYVDPNWDPNEIKKVNSDLFTMVLSTNFEVIHNEAKLSKAIEKYPDDVRKLLGICRHIENKLRSWDKVFTTFFRVDATIPNIMDHPNMCRKCTLVSDTDSVFFTTKHMVNWYVPNEFNTKNVKDIDAFSVFILVQTLEHLFAHMSMDLGWDMSDIGLIEMKNEFYYPVLIRTSRRKHYGGLQERQEGKVLPKMKEDIKGVGFRGSDLSASTKIASNEYIVNTIKYLIENETISTAQLLKPVVDFEIQIHESLKSGSKKYLGTTQIRHKEEYNGDPMSSVYFNYLFWQEVFSHKLGSINVPDKALILPVMGDGAALLNPEWQEQLKQYDRQCYDKFMTFLNQYPKKNISRIVIPVSLEKIPDILQPIMSTRKIIYKNGRPNYMFLESFGIGVNDKHYMYLASDFYNYRDDVAIGM